MTKTAICPVLVTRQLSPLEVWEQLKIRTEYFEEILIHEYGLNEEAALW